MRIETPVKSSDKSIIQGADCREYLAEMRISHEAALFSAEAVQQQAALCPYIEQLHALLDARGLLV